MLQAFRHRGYPGRRRSAVRVACQQNAVGRAQNTYSHRHRPMSRRASVRHTAGRPLDPDTMSRCGGVRFGKRFTVVAASIEEQAHGHIMCLVNLKLLERGKQAGQFGRLVPRRYADRDRSQRESFFWPMPAFERCDFDARQ